MTFNKDYYTFLVMGMLENDSRFQKICSKTCPTTWVDGKRCSPQDDTSNKAFMEIELLMELELI